MLTLSFIQGSKKQTPPKRGGTCLPASYVATALVMTRLEMIADFSSFHV